MRPLPSTGNSPAILQTQRSSMTQFEEVNRPWYNRLEWRYAIPQATSLAKENLKPQLSGMSSFCSTSFRLPLGQYSLMMHKFSGSFTVAPMNLQRLGWSSILAKWKGKEANDNMTQFNLETAYIWSQSTGQLLMYICHNGTDPMSNTLTCTQLLRYLTSPNNYLTLHQPMTHIHIMVSPKPNRNIYGRFNTGHYTLVHGFCFYSLFLIAGKGLI